MTKKEICWCSLIYKNLNQDSATYYLLGIGCQGPTIEDENGENYLPLTFSGDCERIVPPGFIDSFTYNIYSTFKLYKENTFVKNNNYRIKMGQGDSYMELPFKYQPHKFNNTDDLPALVLSDTSYLDKGLLITFDINHDIEDKNLKLDLLQWPFIEQNYTNLRNNKLGIKISKKRNKMTIFFPYKEILNFLNGEAKEGVGALRIRIHIYFNLEYKSIEINKDLIKRKATQK